MGACASRGPCLSAEAAAALKRSRAIEAENEDHFRAERAKIKLLLLGAGESGKSTIFKQIRLLYGAPLTEEDQVTMTSCVHANVLEASKALCEAAAERGTADDVKDAAAFGMVAAVADSAAVSAELGAAIKAVWADPVVRGIWEDRASFQIIESAKYFLDDIDRVSAEGYLATPADILHARVRTTGIVTERYLIDDTQFEIYDVGGQRNERKKWIHCFDNVDAVIFVAALSEYDQTLYEDGSTNRMSEALELFDEICNNPQFAESSMVLFLNKSDLFAEKIRVRNISDTPAFEDFDGQLGDYHLGIEYFLQKFRALNRNTTRTIYSHVTCATDTENVKIVLEACATIIVSSNLKDSGLL